jgi:hypothetical protein
VVATDRLGRPGMGARGAIESRPMASLGSCLDRSAIID